MEYLQEWLNSEGYVKFKEAVKINCEPANESEPYFFKYKARGILKTLKEKLEEDFKNVYNNSNIKNNDSFDCNQKEIIEVLDVNDLLAELCYELGLNFIECEEVSTGEEYLSKCIEYFETENNFKLTSLQLAAYNQLGILWSNRSCHDKAFDYLKKAESLYEKNEKTLYLSYLDFHNIWKPSEEKSSYLESKAYYESLHTLTLYYLAQVLGHLGKPKESAMYCHITLVRQMNTKQYDPLDWSLCCATLSQYYITKDEYKFARYCLSCAEHINKEVFVKFDAEEFSQESEREHSKEKILKSRADIKRCWLKYTLNLLKSSCEKLFEVRERNNENQTLDDTSDKENKLKFGDLEVSVYEEQVTDLFVSNYTDAKKLFNFFNLCLQSAKEFYKLDGYVSDYTEITQDFSQFYKNLALFDDDFENRCKMHKRRIDMLKPILLELNPQHFLQICRQLTFEIAECYTEMADLKRKILEENTDKFSSKAVRKINSLLLQSIKYYNGFVDTYRKAGDLPKDFESDDVRPILMCFFCMARCYAKYLTNDKKGKLEYMHKEKSCYKFIVNYCDNHPDMPKVFEEELSVSKEMYALFDTKLNNVMNSMS
uniref:KIF-binding protein n=1 Tax=Hydra vulgaris TaxID=6087 RepID=T2M835_HYDVU